MIPVQGPTKYPSSPMLARAKFLTSRSRRPSDPQVTEGKSENSNGKNMKKDDNYVTDGFESSENTNKKNIIDRIRSVVSSSPQNTSTNFQPGLPPPTTTNKIGRFFSLKSGGFFGGKLLNSPGPTNCPTNLMDTVPSRSTTSLNSLPDTKETLAKSQKNTEDTKKLQDLDKKGLKRRGSLKENKVQVRDPRTDNPGNGNKVGLVVQNQDMVVGEGGVQQPGAFYTLNKGGDNRIIGGDFRKIPGGVVVRQRAKGNIVKELGEKDVMKYTEGVTDKMLQSKIEKVISFKFILLNGIKNIG